VAIDAGRRRASAIGLAVLLVLIGGAAGVAVDRLVLGAGSGEQAQKRRRGPPSADQVLERYRQRLGLDPEQVAAIRPILLKRIRETTGVFERVDPELESIRRAGDDEVRAHLRPEQRPKLDELRADFEKRRAEMRNRLK
jgi:hypothetical protein